MFGLIEESAKLNLVGVQYDELARLPGMTYEAASSIMDWVDEDSNVERDGAEDEYYLSLPESYYCKNGPLETVDLGAVEVSETGRKRRPFAVARAFDMVPLPAMSPVAGIQTGMSCQGATFCCSRNSAGTQTSFGSGIPTPSPTPFSMPAMSSRSAGPSAL